MVKNVNMNFSRNFDIFAIKMTYLNALLSFLLSSCFSARSLLSELSPCPSPDRPGQGFWVYGVLGLFISGIRYFLVKIRV